MDKPSIIVIGAGPAGTRAAETFVRHGIRPVVFDESSGSGGQIYRRQPAGFKRSSAALYGFEAARADRLHAAYDAIKDKVDYRPRTLVWGISGNAVYAAPVDGGTTSKLSYEALVIATGATDRVVPFEGWTTAGVFTLGAAQIALKFQACTIGERVVFLGTGPLLYLVAYQYAKAGATVAAILDTTGFGTKLRATPKLLAASTAFAKGIYYLGWLRRKGVPIHQGVTPVRVEGDAAVAGVVWKDSDGREHRLACDAVGFGYHVQSETQLADLAGCAFEYEPRSRQWLPIVDEDGRSSVPGVFVAGDGARVRGADFAEAGGELAALSVLQDLGKAVDLSRISVLRRTLGRGLRWAQALQDAFPVPHHFCAGLTDNTIVCRCEVITAGDIRRSARELLSKELNRSKALTRVGMGRCQGRYCGLSAATILAEALGQDASSTSRLRGQAPIKPIPIVPQDAPA